MHPGRMILAEEARQMASGDLAETLPVWDLTDLYSGMDAPEVTADLERSAELSAAFEARYKGKLAELASGGDGGGHLAAAIADFERIEEIMGRLGSYAGLVYSGDTSDPARAKFYGDLQDRLTTISTRLLFFALELNRLDDALVEEALKSPALAIYRPWIEDLRLERPYQLSDDVERLFHEKSVTGRGAWNRLFDETLAGLRFAIDGKPLTLEETLNRLVDQEEGVRKAAAEALAATFKENLRLFTLITNVLAKDKSISDEWRGFTDVAAARHLSNRVEPEIVDALVTAVQQSYPRLSHRYYALKARWLGKEQLEHWDRNAPLPDAISRTVPWDEARETVLSAYGGFAPEMATIAGRFFDRNWIDAPTRPGKAPGAFAHPTVPSVHPYVLLNYQGKVRDVTTLAHELGHGVHQVLAADQGLLMSQTPLTLAETASVFGEMLTFRSMLTRAEICARAEDHAGRQGGGHDQHRGPPDRLLQLRAKGPSGAAERGADRGAARRDLARGAGREPRPGDPLRARLRDLLDLHPALHPFALLRLCLRLRRLPRELALCGLSAGGQRFSGQVFRHAAGRRNEASPGAAGAVRARRQRSRLLADGSVGDRRASHGAGRAVVGCDRVS